MANHKSALKRVRQNKTRKERNKSQRSTVRTAIKKLRQAITDKDQKLKSELFPRVQSLLGKLYSSGIIKRNNAARKISRLAKQLH